MTVTRRSACTAVLLLASALRARAQAPTQVPRIGVLGPSLDRAFDEGLRQLGYVDGRTIVVDRRGLTTRPEQLPQLAAELARSGVAVIVALNNPAVAAARKATATIPIVMVLATDPVGMGFVASLARPGTNVTGLSMQTPELGGRRLQLLKEVVPGLARVAILWDAAEPGRQPLLDEMLAAAPTQGLQAQAFEVRHVRDLDGAFGAMRRANAGALVVLGSSLLYAQRARVAQLAAQERLPTLCTAREWMDAGFVMSYGPRLSDFFRRAPHFVDRILKGTRPADLPVEQPTRFELTFDTRAAKAIGLAIPPALRMRADHVVE